VTGGVNTGPQPLYVDDTTEIPRLLFSDFPEGMGALVFGTTVVVSNSITDPAERKTAFQAALAALRRMQCPAWLPGAAEIALHAIRAARRGGLWQAQARKTKAGNPR
jgi:hypothetical protein